jgi:rare lipoprotein A
VIFETLRAALMLGTILTNVIVFGSPATPFGLMAVPPETTSLPVPAPVPAATPKVLPRLEKVINPVTQAVRLSHGLASWYGHALDRHHTASGEIFDSEKLTAASNLLPMGTRVKVTNLKTGLSVIVKINDRGILSAGRVIDLSKAAAEQIGLLRMGVAPVSLENLAF